MEAPAWMFTKALSHRQKVLRLFKRASRLVDSWYGDDRLEQRYHRVVLRERFDRHKHEKDMRHAQRLLIDGCREVWDKQHPQPIAFANDPFGVAFEREGLPFDLKADMFSYVEKEQFPYYFNRREMRKKELIAHWENIEAGWDRHLESIQKKPPPE